MTWHTLIHFICNRNVRNGNAFSLQLVLSSSILCMQFSRFYTSMWKKHHGEEIRYFYDNKMDSSSIFFVRDDCVILNSKRDLILKRSSVLLIFIEDEWLLVKNIKHVFNITLLLSQIFRTLLEIRNHNYFRKEMNVHFHNEVLLCKK